MALALATAVPAGARVWYIKPDGTGDATTIQAGIDSAQPGDEVLLAPGTYSWTAQGSSGSSMLRLKPGVSLRGEAGPQSTILDAESGSRGAPGRVILCHNVGSDVRIEGLTILNGLARDAVDPPSVHVLGRGGGIYAFADSGVADSSPTIANCSIQDNVAESPGFGGGIACEGGGTILDSQVHDNTAGEEGGGGIYLGHGLIARCTVRDNAAVGDASAVGGGIATGGSVEDCSIEANRSSASFGAEGGGVSLFDAGSLLRCTIVANHSEARHFGSGGGVAVTNGRCEVTDCVFIGNVAMGGSGGALAVDTGADAAILGCTVLANRAQGASGAVGGLDVSGSGSVYRTIIAWSVGAACGGSASYTCTNLYGNSLGDALCGVDLGGNFSLDPQFCAVDPVASRYVRIQSDSPCAVGNHPRGLQCGLIGAGPVGCQTTPVRSETWGEVKSRYR